jgi:ADP-heptose:LPS heptosyltransferase
MSNNLYIQINGGVGKHISFTSLLPILKNKYENIYISSIYGDVFKGNPYVNQINPKIDKTFYKNIILNDNTKIVLTDPYDYEPFLKKKIHVLQAIGDLCEIQVDKPMSLKTELYMTENEKFTVDKIVNELRKRTKDKFIMIQLNGGQSPHNFDMDNQKEFSFFNEEVRRFYPFDYYIELIKKLKEKYPEYAILRYGLMNEPMPYEISSTILNIQPAILYKNYYWISQYAKHVICIDSSLHHMTAGMKPSTVIWGSTKPEHFGYSIHKNLEENNENTICYFRQLGENSPNIKFPSPDKVMENLI